MLLHLRLVTSILGCAIAATYVAPGAHHTAPAPRRQASPEVLFFDDFSGRTLDRTKWNVEVNSRPPNNEQEAYVDSRDTLYIAHGRAAEGAANGALVIKALYRQGAAGPGGAQKDFLSARIDTRHKEEFLYGKAEARMKLPAGSGFWPAFWMLGNGRWPAIGEIDIMENVGDPSWISFALHGPGYSGSSPIGSRFHFAEGADVTQWHVYAVDWKPDTISFQVDGQEQFHVTRAMVERRGRWAYDNPKFIILNLALGGGYPQAIDHIGAPYPGLSDQAVDLIKSGRGRVLVDWVRVTKNQP